MCEVSMPLKLCILGAVLRNLLRASCRKRRRAHTAGTKSLVSFGKVTSRPPLQGVVHVESPTPRMYSP
jgi:hypothetical protein